MALLKLCSCGKVIAAVLSRCPACETKHESRHQLYDNHRRDKKADRFYKSREWRVVRKQALTRDHGLCQHCLKHHRVTYAKIVDHVVPLRIAWQFRASLTNLQSLCDRCHAIKTAEDKRKYNI